MALVTVQDYINRARTLLQDTSTPYRYTTADLIEALNMGLLEARKLRPDMLRSSFRAGTGGVSDVTQYLEADVAETVDIDQMYRTAFVYFIVGQAQLRDEEDVTDARASAFLNKFTSQLLSIQP